MQKTTRDVPHGAELSEQVEELLWSNVEAVHVVSIKLRCRDAPREIFTSGSSRRELCTGKIKLAMIECGGMRARCRAGAQGSAEWGP